MAMLSNGLVVSGLYDSYRVERFIASGSQGSVYEISAGGKRYALKWYQNGNDNLKNHFRNLIQSGAPKLSGAGFDERFVWPLDLVSYSGGFGYVMKLIEQGKYVNLFEIINIDKNYPSNEILCKICINMADAFNNLHADGFCYKDLSHNNILMDIKTGDILIVDVDNVCVSGESGEIAGTPKFMAPEVVLGKEPDRESDKFSLAAIYFYLFLGHNPLEGKLRDDYCRKYGVLDQKSFEYIYGNNATFCFNSKDNSNNLNESNEYSFIVKRWNCNIPEKMKKKFEQTFVAGISYKKRSLRTTDREWKNLFSEMKNSISKCKNCGNEYFEGAKKCYKCGVALSEGKTEPVVLTTQSVPKYKVVVDVKERGAQGVRQISICENTIISGSQIGEQLNAYPNLARVLKNPNTGELGLENMSDMEWHYKDPTDTELGKVPKNKIVALKKGRIIAFIRGIIQIEVR